jgi:hypothetical protein
MFEKILSIEEVFDVKVYGDGYTTFDGFYIKTTEQTVKLLIEQSETSELDCETGYFLSHENLEEFVGSDLYKIRVTGTQLVEKELPVMAEAALFVNIETSKGTLQFTAYNDHNGHYGHDAYVFSDCLTHKEKL